MNGSHLINGGIYSSTRNIDNNKINKEKRAQKEDTLFFDSIEIIHGIWMSMNRRSWFLFLMPMCAFATASRQLNVVNNSKCDWNINEANPHPHNESKKNDTQQQTAEYFTQPNRANKL